MNPTRPTHPAKRDEFAAYFGFFKEPFTKDIAAKALYLSAQLQALFTRLKALLSRRGMALITGEVGSGKSTALRGFAEALEKTQYDWVYIDDPTVGRRGIWNSIATQLNLTTRFFKWQLMPALKSAIEKNHPAFGGTKPPSSSSMMRNS